MDPHPQTQSTWADVSWCYQGTWSSELWAVLLLNIPQTHLVPCPPCSSPQESPHQHSAAPATPESVLRATANGSFYTCIADLCFTALRGPQNRAQQPWVCAPATGSASHCLKHCNFMAPEPLQETFSPTPVPPHSFPPPVPYLPGLGLCCHLWESLSDPPAQARPFVLRLSEPSELTSWPCHICKCVCVEYSTPC